MKFTRQLAVSPLPEVEIDALIMERLRLKQKDLEELLLAPKTVEPPKLRSCPRCGPVLKCPRCASWDCM